MTSPEAEKTAGGAAPDEVLPSLEPAAAVEKKRGRRSTLLIALAAVLCLAGLGAGAWMIFFSSSAPDQPVKAPPAVNATAQAEAAARVAHINLVDTRQFIVKNDKLGDMVVIKGRAVNNFKEAKRFIMVEARLLTRNGTELARQTRLCGPDPFLTQLQVLTAEGLEEALSSRVEILLNNSNVQPGQDTPFWFVFPPIKPEVPEGEKTAEGASDGSAEEPWKELWEFEVHPVDAQDVPPGEAGAPPANG